MQPTALHAKLELGRVVLPLFGEQACALSPAGDVRIEGMDPGRWRLGTMWVVDSGLGSQKSTFRAVTPRSSLYCFSMP